MKIFNYIKKFFFKDKYTIKITPLSTSYYENGELFRQYAPDTRYAKDALRIKLPLYIIYL